MSIVSEHMILGVQMAKIKFWASQYEFSFQFWGEHNNTIYINRDGIELASNGGHLTMNTIIDWTIDWCEKANPRKKYPWLTKIDLPE